MKRILLALAFLLACATPMDGAPRMAVHVTNGFRDPVDVSFYCGTGLHKRERWVMSSEVRKLYISVGPGCDFRVIIRSSLEGGPLTRPEPFDSGRELFTSRDCRRLDIIVSGILPASYVHPKGCR